MRSATSLLTLFFVGLNLVSGIAVAQDLEKAIKAKFERVPLAHLPTPLEEMKGLTAVLGGPTLYIKRDDQTGLAFGGNKARKLEFIFSDVLEKKADVVITGAGVQSNWARQTAAASRMFGIQPILVLSKSASKPIAYDGNLLLDVILGADVRFIEPGESRNEAMEKIAAEVKARGHRPYTVSVGGSRVGGSMTEPLGAIAYANSMHEIHAQAQEQNIDIDYVVVATGSGGTQAGMMVGAKAVDPDIKVVGIMVSPGEKSRSQKNLTDIANLTAKTLGLDMSFTPEEAIVFNDYGGEGYGILYQGVVDAIRLVARNDAVMLDPVYTGKAMAGMIDLVSKGYFEKDANVVFWHTGGTPALFVYREEILEYLKKGQTN